MWEGKKYVLATSESRARSNREMAAQCAALGRCCVSGPGTDPGGGDLF